MIQPIEKFLIILTLWSAQHSIYLPFEGEQIEYFIAELVVNCRD